MMYFHEFECIDCEGHVLIEAQDLHNLHGEEWLPKFCPYCGKQNTLFLDWKRQLREEIAIDVRTCGFKAEDINASSHLTCNCCGCIIPPDENYGDDNTVLCDECYEEHYCRCTDCECLKSRDDVYHYDDCIEDIPYCADCFIKRLDRTE